MGKINKLNVLYNQRKVGTMALYKKNLAAFEYEKEWLADGFSISPFSLPMKQQVFVPRNNQPFEKFYLFI